MPPIEPNNNNEGNDLAKRRLEAVRAMEGELGRKRREIRDFQRRERDLSQITAKEQVERAQESAAWKTAQEKALAEKSEREKVKAQKARVEKINQSEAFVADLRSSAADINPMRTLKTDMARAVKEEGISISSIAVSEQVKKQLGKATEPDGPAKTNNRLLFLLIILVLAVVGAGVYLWWSSQPEPVPVINPASTVPEPFFFAEAAAAIDVGEAKNQADPRRLVNASALPADFGTRSVKQLYFTRGSVALTGPELARAFGWELPDSLFRNFDAPYMFGVYNDGEKNNRFLIMSVKLYDQAFAGMLAWEKNLAEDLLPLLTDIPAGQPAPVTTDFKDKLLRNKDARYTTNLEDKTVLFYSFLDQNTIAFTPNEATFIELLGRYINAKT